MSRPAAEAARERWHARLRRMVVICRTRPCRRFTVAHPLLRRDGVYLHGAWCCSAACLEEALLRRLALPDEESGDGRRRLFWHVLLRNRVVSEAVLQWALRLAGEEQLTLEAVLLRKQVVTARQIAAAYAESAGVPCVLTGVSVAPENQLPPWLAHRYGAVAVSDAGSRLLLGFSGTIHPALLRAAGRVTGLRVEPCIVPAGHAGAMPAHPERDMQFGISRAGACSALVAAAAREGAEHLRAAAGTGWVWAVLEGRRRSSHLFVEQTREAGIEQTWKSKMHP